MSDQFVIAGTFQQYRQWLGRRSQQEYRFVSTPMRLRGTLGGVLWRVGTWYERDDNYRACDVAAACGMRIENAP